MYIVVVAVADDLAIVDVAVDEAEVGVAAVVGAEELVVGYAVLGKDDDPGAVYSQPVAQYVVVLPVASGQAILDRPEGQVLARWGR